MSRLDYYGLVLEVKTINNEQLLLKVLTPDAIIDFVEVNLKRFTNGKIVGMCDCDNVEEIFNDKLYWKDFNGWTYDISTNTLCGSELFKKSCLKGNELMQYLGDKNGYALYLSNVKAFDKPEPLPSFEYLQKNKEQGNKFSVLGTVPQNMMYVYDSKGNRYILLSIHPKDLCKIMNGEKTIEIRRKILNSLKKEIEVL